MLCGMILTCACACFFDLLPPPPPTAAYCNNNMQSIRYERTASKIDRTSRCSNMPAGGAVDQAHLLTRTKCRLLLAVFESFEVSIVKFSDQTSMSNSQRQTAENCLKKSREAIEYVRETCAHCSSSATTRRRIDQQRMEAYWNAARSVIDVGYHKQNMWWQSDLRLYDVMMKTCEAAHLTTLVPPSVSSLACERRRQWIAHNVALTSCQTVSAPPATALCQPFVYLKGALQAVINGYTSRI